MKAAILDTLGSLPRYGEFEEPVPVPGEEIVTVRTAAIKPIDRAIAAGSHYGSPRELPVICGMDGVGHAGDGSRVYFNALRRPFGAMAERSPAQLLVPVPDGLSDELAAAIVNPAIAAWLPLLWRGRLEAGETVLILGATGSAGRFAVRAARLLGAGRVIAAGRRQDVLETLDADAVIDLTAPEADIAKALAAEAAGGIQVVVDYLWGRPAELTIESLVKHDVVTIAEHRATRFVSVGEMAGSSIALGGMSLRASRLEIMGSGTANIPPADRMREIVSDIFAHAAEGRLDMAVSVFPLQAVREAWTAAESGEIRPVLAL